MPGIFDDIPTDPGEQIKWCAAKFKELQESGSAKRLSLHRNKAKGYQITVWELNGLYYLIQCIRNEFGTFNDTVYISRDGQDMLNIAKFLKENIETIMADYKAQILDARNALLSERDNVDHRA